MPRLSTSEQRERVLAPPLGTRPLDMLVWYKPMPMDTLLVPGSLPLPRVWGAQPAEVRVAVGTTAQALTVVLKTLAVLWILQEMNVSWHQLDERAAIAFLIQFVVDMFRSWAILALAILVRRTPGRHMCKTIWPTVVVLSFLSFGEIGSFVVSQVFYSKARSRWHKSDKLELLELETMGLLFLDLALWLACHIIYLFGEAPINEFLKEEIFPDQVYVILPSGAVGRAISRLTMPRPSTSAGLSDRAPVVPPAQSQSQSQPTPAQAIEPARPARPAGPTQSEPRVPPTPTQPTPTIPPDTPHGAATSPPRAAGAAAEDRDWRDRKSSAPAATATGTLVDLPPPYSVEGSGEAEPSQMSQAGQTGQGQATIPPETASMAERLPHLPERPRQGETLEWDWDEGNATIPNSESDPNAAWRS